jgi:hypothetical protein
MRFQHQVPLSAVSSFSNCRFCDKKAYLNVGGKGEKDTPGGQGEGASVPVGEDAPVPEGESVPAPQGHGAPLSEDEGAAVP